MIEARLRDARIETEKSDEAIKLLSKGYGSEDQASGLIVYSYPEALYLVETGRMKIILSSGEGLDFNRLLATLKQLDENIWRDYVVYRDLRERNYVVKDGVNKELRFRVFERGKYGEEPARYLIAPLMEGKNISVEKMIEWLSAARKLRKELVIAVVDRRNEVIYYKASIVDLRNV
ncbi:MAG: tRNA-intron lyase [Nitrososphaerota archaeon]